MQDIHGRPHQHVLTGKGLAWLQPWVLQMTALKCSVIDDADLELLLAVVGQL